ncbi:MAG TPA: PQQ-binding-like beta-propeller repeat protein [Candidatus Bathyarchaeia archaeon]
MSKNVKPTALAMLLTFTIALTLVALPADAQTTGGKTYPFINATPNPVQVGQETLLHIGISRSTILAYQGWEGLTVTVTKPNGSNSTLGPFKTDSTGGTGAVLVPDEVGTWYVQTNFPGQWFNYSGSDGRGGFVSYSVFLEASTSERLPVIVQADPLPIYPGAPLPTEYWTRPIDTQAYDWSTISGSWFDGSRRLPQYMPYNDGPETAHVLWTKAETNGGLVGGALDNSLALNSIFFEIGDAYEGKFASRLILAGRLYYDKYASSDNTREMVCVDLHTGKTLWSRTLVDNNGQSVMTPAPGGTTTPARPIRGQLLYWKTYDMQGVFDYLWVIVGSTWHAFDPSTGSWVYALTNVPSGTITYGPMGEILVYTVNLQRGWMTLWNSTNVFAQYVSTEYGSMGFGQWRPQGKIIDATGPIIAPFMPPTAAWNASGYMWNKTIPTAAVGSLSYVYPLDRAIFTDIISDRPGPTTRAISSIRIWALNLKVGNEGQALFDKTWQTPASWLEGNTTAVFEAISPESTDGVYVVGARDLKQHYGFSTETGDFLWETDPENYLNWYGIGGIGGERPPMIAYGKFMTSGIGGIVYAYDTVTGERVWTYNATDPYGETLFTNNWWLYPIFVTDGKIYYGHLEHSPNSPFPRGAPFIALDVETGEEVFKVNGMFRQTLWGGLGIIGDSIIATQDTYDNRIYAIGKGPTATTVSAPDVGINLGSSIVIKGTVMDISPGTADSALTMRFSNGVPAVSDESMSEWMLYVYKQFVRPTDATGVPVTIDVIDSNNNYRNIGSATTDSSGMFQFAWKPDIEGAYKVIATFGGSKAYYASYAETAFVVDTAPDTTGPEPQGPSLADQYLLPATLGIIASVVIVGIVLALVLRKRP